MFKGQNDNESSILDAQWAARLLQNNCPMQFRGVGPPLPHNDLSEKLHGTQTPPGVRETPVLSILEGHEDQ